MCGKNSLFITLTRGFKERVIVLMVLKFIFEHNPTLKEIATKHSSFILLTRQNAAAHNDFSDNAPCDFYHIVLVEMASGPREGHRLQHFGWMVVLPRPLYFAQETSQN